MQSHKDTSWGSSNGSHPQQTLIRSKQIGHRLSKITTDQNASTSSLLVKQQHTITNSNQGQGIIRTRRASGNFHTPIKSYKSAIKNQQRLQKTSKKQQQTQKAMKEQRQIQKAMKEQRQKQKAKQIEEYKERREHQAARTVISASRPLHTVVGRWITQRKLKSTKKETDYQGFVKPTFADIPINLKVIHVILVRDQCQILFRERCQNFVGRLI